MPQIGILLFLVAAAGAAEPSGIDLAVAAATFREADAICRRDAGELWGVSLCGPMLFTDAATRQVVANRADAGGALGEEAGVHVGRLPDDVNVANTSLEWSGVRWTMVLWPLPEDPESRAVLLMHESFHRVQPDLGLPAHNPANAHLDSLAGRYWLQLEWRALAAALEGVYPTLRATADWGILEVTAGGAFVDAGWSRAQVPAVFERAGAVLRGEGWSLELAPGWTLEPGEREGDVRLGPAR